MKVLLIEDAVGDPIAKFLRKWGHEVTFVQNARDGLATAQRHSIDFFIVDWNLPGTSGLSITSQLRKIDAYKNTPILMISGRTKKEDILTALRSGVDGYLTKPFTATQLREKIAQTKKASAEKWAKSRRIAAIIRGHAIFDPQNSNPLILFGERFDTARGLAAPDQAPVVNYLAAATNAIDTANRHNRYLDLGYLIATSTGDIVRHLKSWGTRDRIKLVALSTECHGNYLLMARLLHANGLDQVPVFIICDYIEKIPGKVRSELADYGLTLCERRDFDEGKWRAQVHQYATGASPHTAVGQQ